MSDFPNHINKLALFRRFIEQAQSKWPDFLKRRQERLIQVGRNNGAAEKVAENILDDFFTVALDWKLENLNNQVNYADMLLTQNGIGRLIVEVKRPGSLKWDRSSVERALEQAWRYADQQRIKTIAISDGSLFYAADIENGGLTPRTKLRLDSNNYSPNSWWVSVEGIYRTPELLPEIVPPGQFQVDEQIPQEESLERNVNSTLIHPKYQIPAECFAYVGNASDPKTWKLPCWLINGDVDTDRLPGAIRAVLSTYRGTRAIIPEAAIPDVLVRLGKAAAFAKKLPGQTSAPLESYQQLHKALYQIDRLKEVLTP